MRQGLSVRQKIFYGAGDIMGTTAFTITATFLLFYFTDVMKIPSFLAGLILFLGAFWDALTDPWAGFVSDRTRTRFGRRRPFFLFTALPIGVSFVLLFAVPVSFPLVWKFILLTLAYLAYMTTTTFYMVPYLAYGMEIERSYDGRTSVTAWRMFFSIAFGLVALVVPPMIWNSAPTASEGYFIMALIFAVPLIVSPLFPFFAWREPAALPEVKSKFFDNLKKALKSGHFRKGSLIYITTWVGIGVVEAVLLYYFKYVLFLYDDFSLIVGVMFAVAILSLPLWVFISKKLDKRKAYIIGAAAFGLLLCVLLLPAQAVRFVLWVIVPLLGVALSSLHVMPSAILPEAIEAVSGTISGQGANYGILTFIHKTINGLALWGVSGILSLAGYIPSQDNVYVPQPQSAVDTIHVIIAAVPAVLLAIGIAAAARLNIGRQGVIPEKGEKGASL